MPRLAVAATTLAFVCATLVVSAEPPQARPPAGASGRGLIIGRVIDTGGAPVPRAKVVLSRGEGWGPDPNRSLFLTVIADEDGEFAFTDLPAGHFAARASKPGYVDGSSDRDAATLANDADRKTDVIVRVTKLASVTGTLLDETSAPIVNASVQAFKTVIVSGRTRFDVASGALSRPSDEDGRYRISNLPVGEYAFMLDSSAVRIRLAAGDPRDPHVETFSYPRAIVPAPSKDGAIAAVSIAAGRELANINFRVALVPTSRVSGRVTPVPAPETVSARLRPQWPGATASLASSFHLGMGVQRDGTFSIDDLVAGEYVLELESRNSVESRPPGGGETVIQMPQGGTITSWVNLSGQPAPPPPMPTTAAMFASLPLIVGPGGIEQLQVTMQPGPLVMARLVFDGASTPPTEERIRMSSVGIEPAEGSTYGDVLRARAVIGPDHRFGVVDLKPGRYVFKASVGGWALRSVIVNGRDVSDVPVEFAAGEKVDVALVFTDKSTIIKGFVTGFTPGDVLKVLFFPADSRRWVDYGRVSNRIEARNAGRDGNFTIYLPSGDYFFLATSSDPGTNWQDAENLKRLSSLAERLTLSEGEQLMFNLRAVQIPPR